MRVTGSRTESVRRRVGCSRVSFEDRRREHARKCKCVEYTVDRDFIERLSTNKSKKKKDRGKPKTDNARFVGGHAMSPEGNAPYVLPYYYCQRRQTGLDPGGFEKNNVLQYVTGVGIYRVFGRL